MDEQKALAMHRGASPPGGGFSRRDLLISTLALAAGSLVPGCSGGFFGRGDDSGGGAGGQGPAALVSEVEKSVTATLVDDLGDSLTSRFVNLPLTVPQAAKLVAGGAASTPAILAKLTGKPAFEQDNQILIYAYVLSKILDRTAARALTDFVERNRGGSLLYGMSAAVRALRILTDQSVPADLAFYDPLQIDATIAAARAWVTAHPSVIQRGVAASRAPALFGGASCTTNYVVTRNGNPIFWNNPDQGGQGMKLTIPVQRFADLNVPAATAAGKTSDTVNGGGTLIEAFDGQPVDPLKGRASKYCNCAGFVLLQKFGIRGNYDTLSLIKRLTAAGMVERGLLESPVKGDVVAFFEGTAIPHVAVVSATSPNTQVINKDNQGPVFLADTTAKYFTGVVTVYSRAKWKPHFYHFPTSAGLIDLVVDDDPAVLGNAGFCQSSTGHVGGVIK